MVSIRRDARRRGLRMAAQVAAITGCVAAAAAFSQAAEPPRAPMGAGSEGVSATEESDPTGPATRVPSMTQVKLLGGCGCAPCWGPPAPPPMRPELLDFAEEESS
jgi:hypothetical protein